MTLPDWECYNVIMDSNLNEFPHWHRKHSFTCVPDRSGSGKDFLDAAGKNDG